MLRSAVGLLTLCLCASACSSDAGDDPAAQGSTAATSGPAPGTTAAEISTPSDLATSVTTQAVSGCGPGPSVVLRGAADAVNADLVFFEESSPTCQLNADGAAVDPSFRPERFLVALEGTIDLVVDEPADVRVDIREFDPNSGVGVSELGGAPLAATGDTYPLALPGPGCFVVTIGFESATRRGQFVGLVASSADIC